MNEFFSWSFLASFGGACIATGIVTQFVKNMFVGVPTQLLAYVVAALISMATLLGTGSFTMQAAVLGLLNSFLVATAASGTYDFAKRIGEMNSAGH